MLLPIPSHVSEKTDWTLAIEHLRQAAREAERVTTEQCIPVELVLTPEGVRIRVGGTSLGHELQNVVTFAEIDAAMSNPVVPVLLEAVRRFKG